LGFLYAMNQKDLYILLYLAQKTQLQQSFKTSTSLIAAELGISQQTVSRKLLDVASAGMIQRRVTLSGVEIRMSPEGRKHLFSLYGDLKHLFTAKQELIGAVTSGLGEGRFYMKQPLYKKQFQSILGYVPFAGTLNLIVDRFAVDAFLATKKMQYINGFVTKKRSFGGLRCYPILIHNTNNTINAALIIPDRNIHGHDTVELIAAECLRTVLQVKNNDEVVVQ